MTTRRGFLGVLGAIAGGLGAAAARAAPSVEPVADRGLETARQRFKVATLSTLGGQIEVTVDSASHTHPISDPGHTHAYSGPASSHTHSARALSPYAPWRGI